MLKTKLSDLNLIITDKTMKTVYNTETLDISNCNIIDEEDIRFLNLYNRPEKVLEIKDKLKDHFFFIAGSSNFHHLDVANLSRIQTKHNKKVQLILFDAHPDCYKFFPKSNFLHCGNWISYAYQKGIIERVALIGGRDARHLKIFDHSLIKNGDLVYHSDLTQPIDSDFFDPNTSLYLSVDTDILNVSSDWGPGLHSIESIIQSPIWNQLSNQKLAGACIIGHITDNRRILDFIKSYFQLYGKIKTKESLKELLRFTKVVYSKSYASLKGRQLPLEKQLEIIFTFYKKSNRL